MSKTVKDMVNTTVECVAARTEEGTVNVVTRTAENTVTETVVSTMNGIKRMIDRSESYVLA